MSQEFPSLFISHGAPTLILEDVPARAFLSSLGARVGRPDAIVAVSAHHIGRGAVARAAPKLETVHDFHGFPDELYRYRYEPLGHPALARDIVDRLRGSDIAATLDESPGIDHGAWVPLALMYPDAAIPVVPLSLDATMSEREHVAIGRALAPLRQRNVLVLASGGFTHNLREFGRYGDAHAPTAAYVAEFATWMTSAMANGDEASLLEWRNKAPHAARAHPTPEHLMPLFVAYGAGGERPSVERLHHSVTYGILAMDAFAFH
jgi:4,5-DOPA dioxygenase extradiol